MSKKSIIYLFLAVFLILNPKNIQAEVSKGAKLDIKLVKEIPTSLEGSLGTIYIAKVGDYLLLHDSHVSDRKLVCVEYSTGKEIWSLDKKVERFYIYNGKVLVDLLNDIALFNIKTGKEIWRIKNSGISYEYKNASEVYNNLLVDHKSPIDSRVEKAVLDLETQKVKHYKHQAVIAHYFKVGDKDSKKSIIGVKRDYPLRIKTLKTIIVEDKGGVKKKYIWTINKRNYNLISLNIKNSKEISRITWKMDDKKQYPKDYFNGHPELEKLDASVYFINNQLFLFENYVNYRWSWQRGNNRLTRIDWKTGKIVYQKWGQKPLDKVFKTFHFFKDIILMSDSIMHFQDGKGEFAMFNDKKGISTDLLPKKITLFKDFDSQNLLAFNYIRKHIKEKTYTNTVEMKLWNKVKNKFSKTFSFEYKEKYPFPPIVFGEDGLVMFYFYLRDKHKSILHVYKVNK